MVMVLMILIYTVVSVEMIIIVTARVVAMRACGDSVSFRCLSQLLPNTTMATAPPQPFAESQKQLQSLPARLNMKRSRC